MSDKEPEETITVTVDEDARELTDKLLDTVAVHGQAMGKYSFLPLDTIVALDELGEEFPGLRWMLRKQRGHSYELRVFQSKHLEAWEVKGEP